MTQASILRFYFPLALSWLMMAVEGPIAVGIMSRLPNPELNTAAFQIMFTLALWIESPVIDLLSTSTTLSKSRQNYVQLSRFAWWMMIIVTVVHATVALTPIFSWVTLHPRLLNLPLEVSEAARPAMIIMIPWSACIGWRRYLQGILIRYGRTRLVGAGTLVRVTAVAISGVLLYRFSSLPGVQIVAIALICSVFSEAMFIHFASRQTVRERFATDEPDDEEPLRMKRLTKFHLPLTATTMVMFIGGPLVSAALARSPNQVLVLAAWSVCTTLLFLHRTVVFALPEVVITLAKDPDSARALAKFCTRVGLITSGSILIVSLTGLDMLFFIRVLGTEQSIAEMAHVGFIAGAAMPLIGALQSYVRGMLTAKHLTVSRLYAVAVAVSTLAICLLVGVSLKVPGILNAAASLTISMIAEFTVLALAWRYGSRRLSAAQ